MVRFFAYLSTNRTNDINSNKLKKLIGSNFLYILMFLLQKIKKYDIFYGINFM